MKDFMKLKDLPHVSINQLSSGERVSLETTFPSENSAGDEDILHYIQLKKNSISILAFFF